MITDETDVRFAVSKIKQNFQFILCVANTYECYVKKKKLIWFWKKIKDSHSTFNCKRTLSSWKVISSQICILYVFICNEINEVNEDKDINIPFIWLEN